MSSHRSNSSTQFQTELTALRNGLADSTATDLQRLVVAGVSMSKAEAIAKLDAVLALFTAVTEARRAYLATTASKKAALPSAITFYGYLVTALRQVIGPYSPDLLCGLGVPLPTQRRVPSAETRAIAQAKAAATRKARGTMGKNQRAAILASPQPTLEVVAPDGTSLLSTASSTPSPQGNA